MGVGEGPPRCTDGCCCCALFRIGERGLATFSCGTLSSLLEEETVGRRRDTSVPPCALSPGRGEKLPGALGRPGACCIFANYLGSILRLLCARDAPTRTQGAIEPPTRICVVALGFVSVRMSVKWLVVHMLSLMRQESSDRV
jgi:hypothetical protein